MDLNGTWNGIPKKVLIPVGAIVVVGGYVFVKKYRASKAASASSSTTGASAGTTGTSNTDSAYGPIPGNGALNVMLPESETQSNLATGRYQALSTADVSIVQQNQQIIQALASLHDIESRSAVGVAALADHVPGTVADIQSKNQANWEQGIENSRAPYPVAAQAPH